MLVGLVLSDSFGLCSNLRARHFYLRYVVYVISYSSSRLTLESKKSGAWHRDRPVGRATSRMS